MLNDDPRRARWRASLLRTLLGALILFFAVTAALAQQPFVTDDADTVPKGKFELQLVNEMDVLQREEYPAKTQNTASAELSYGLTDDIEIGFAPPLLAVHNARVVSPRTVAGLGDATLHVKYNFYKEREGSRLPAMSITGVVQFPTGSVSRGLGTGLYDYYVNGVLQKSISEKTKVRLNGGILFAGSTVNGELGIRTRGRVFTGGGSIVKQVSKRLDLGVELTGAVTSNFQLSKGQLQGQFGGNYALRKNMTLDFGLVAGRFVASPRAGALLGLTVEF
jgi:hypothetical protein